MYATQIPVLMTHMNYGIHVGSDAYLSFMAEGRIAWLKSVNLSELNVGDNTAYVIKHFSADYLGESVHGDILRIEVTVKNIRKVSFDFIYRIINTSHDKLVATGHSTQAFINLTTKKVSPCPTSFINVLKTILVDSSS